MSDCASSLPINERKNLARYLPGAETSVRTQTRTSTRTAIILKRLSFLRKPDVSKASVARHGLVTEIDAAEELLHSERLRIIHAEMQ
eukprot:scaffold151164_cov31-Prasinocladus_malaysianus.AAC.5